MREQPCVVRPNPSWVVKRVRNKSRRARSDPRRPELRFFFRFLFFLFLFFLNFASILSSSLSATLRRASQSLSPPPSPSPPPHLLIFSLLALPNLVPVCSVFRRPYSLSLCPLYRLLPGGARDAPYVLGSSSSSSSSGRSSHPSLLPNRRDPHCHQAQERRHRYHRRRLPLVRPSLSGASFSPFSPSFTTV